MFFQKLALSLGRFIVYFPFFLIMCSLAREHLFKFLAHKGPAGSLP